MSIPNNKKHFFPEFNKFLYCIKLEDAVKISSIIMAVNITKYY